MSQHELLNKHSKVIEYKILHIKKQTTNQNRKEVNIVKIDWDFLEGFLNATIIGAVILIMLYT